MDKNFMDKVNFVFGLVRSILLIIAMIVGAAVIIQFSYTLGEMKDRIHVLELQNPIQPKGE